ncbi:peptide methionine sulfoxide reductase A5 [Tanacetum coccineum]|uniref:peptide-methionine (S)-S-oxide reductase n=1 Tax=Tanacetum coccineum TaxID=301880 RepID=A0ABQ5FHG1_9ASTR
MQSAAKQIFGTSSEVSCIPQLLQLTERHRPKTSRYWKFKWTDFARFWILGSGRSYHLSDLFVFVLLKYECMTSFTLVYELEFCKTGFDYDQMGSYKIQEIRGIEYDPRLINFRQLLEVFWSSHDSRQVFGQGPDVGNQYRSIIFINGTEESRLASVSKEQEQSKSRSSIVTTQIQQLGTFYPAEPEHQKFELKRNPFLLQLIGNLAEEELEKSSLAAKLNGYAAELCPPIIQSRIDGKVNEIIRKGWPILREV